MYIQHILSWIFGCGSDDRLVTVKYPEYGKRTPELLAGGQCDQVILFCGTS